MKEEKTLGMLLTDTSDCAKCGRGEVEKREVWVYSTMYKGFLCTNCAFDPNNYNFMSQTIQTEQTADGYYSDEADDSELDLSFLDEEGQNDDNT